MHIILRPTTDLPIPEPCADCGGSPVAVEVALEKTGRRFRLCATCRKRLATDLLADKNDHLRREVDRLNNWLAKIDGGDHPCTDESQLRQWAYEAITLMHACP